MVSHHVYAVHAYAKIERRRFHTKASKRIRIRIKQKRKRLSHRQVRMMRWQIRATRAVRYAQRQLGKPYVWGGEGPRGFDCSGLAWRSWLRAGVRLPRVADDQYRRTRPKIRRRDLLPGDLVFFHGLGHVGIYKGRGRFIHAPNRRSRVRVQRLSGFYRRSYVGAARPGWNIKAVRADVRNKAPKQHKPKKHKRRLHTKAGPPRDWKRR